MTKRKMDGVGGNEKTTGGVTGKGFLPGKSGNPSGRPKSMTEVVEMARALTPEAIERLTFWMRSDNPKASVAAAQTLWDRAWGKAPQTIDLSSSDGSMSPPSIVLVPVTQKQLDDAKRTEN